MIYTRVKGVCENTEYRICRHTGYRIQETEYRIQITKIQNIEYVGYRIQGTGYRIQDTG